MVDETKADAGRAAASKHVTIRPLYSEARLREAVRHVAEEIVRDYGDGPLHLIGVLRGSFIFLADLTRAVVEVGGAPAHLSVDFIGTSSYEGMNTTGEVKVTVPLMRSIEGKRVIVVEDIIDTGLTAHAMMRHLVTLGPTSAKFAVLLDNPTRRRAAFEPDYTGIRMERDAFVVGYGLDMSEQYRALPYVAEVMRDE